MLTLEQLKESFGDEEGQRLHTYLSNKHRGGNNNSKGNNFENYFAVFKIADLWIKSTDPQNTKISSQVLCFIDDMVLENPTEGIKVEHYQIKDIRGISWDANENSLKEDYKKQYQVYAPAGIVPNLYLVVSDSGLEEKLKRSIPDDIKSFTEIVCFPTADSINNLLRVNLDFKNKIKQICALSDPHMSSLETVAATLLGAWDASDKKQVTLKKLKEDCRKQSPHYLKGSTEHASEALVEKLSNIQNFTFKFEHGFLWRTWNLFCNTIYHGKITFQHSRQKRTGPFEPIG